MDSQILSWLLSGPEWLRYAVRTQLLDETVDSTAAVADASIQGILSTLFDNQDGFEALYRHEVSYTGNLFWYLFFLSDIGLPAAGLGLEESFNRIFEHEGDDHTFMLSKEMKPRYYCISSILLTSLARMSEDAKARLKPHIELLLEEQRIDGGWHCALSRAVGKAKEHSASCAMDNLNNLMLLAEYDEYRHSGRLEGAIDLLLNHWRRRDEPWRPYGFGIGTDFCKLRYPAFKYGILRVLDVLSRFP